jgi:hypothetical protein
VNENLKKGIPARKAAPVMIVSEVTRDLRIEQINRLNEQEPNFMHSYHHPNVTDAELARGGFEVVKDKEGNVLEHGGDPVVRRPRKDAEADFANASRYSHQLAEKTVKESRRAQLTKKARFKAVAAKPDEGAT